MGSLNPHNLKEYINKYSTNVFIETGTGNGNGVLIATENSFEKIFSIEIIKEIYDKLTIEDFRVTFLNEDSITGLKIILQELLEPNDTILFWLDAHFPGADFKIDGYSYYDEIDKDIKFPLEAELSTIMSLRDYRNDVFIIDDLRLYDDGEYQGGNLDLKDKELFRDKYLLESIWSVFLVLAETHDILIENKEQGSLILTPKEIICS